MSLTGKQVRELQALYESVYAEKPEKEDVILTQEEFDQLCLVILQEAFESSGVEIFEGRRKLTMLDKGYKHIVKPAIDYVKKNKFQLGATAGLTGAGTYDGGVNVKHGGAILKNLKDFIGGTRQMVDKNTEGAGMLQVDKKTGEIDSTKTTKNVKRIQDKYRESFEFDTFNLHIVENYADLEDLKKELNKQKNNKKDNTNINTNIKDNTPKTDTPKVDTPKTDTPKTDTPKVDTPKTDTPKTDTPKTDTPKTDTPKTDTPKTDTPKVDSSKVDTSKEIESSEAEFKANEGDKFNKYQKDKIKKEKDQKRHDDAKKKDKLLSTHIPIVSKTKLGSTVRPVKPGSARDKMIAKNELRHGSDHIVGLRNMNADFQRMKKGEISKADFIKAYPKSQTAKKAKMKKLNMSYEPYDLVLDYVLSEGHANTVEEAHYVMMQMSQDTIQTIISEYENV